jgi:hypothetical protein
VQRVKADFLIPESDGKLHFAGAPFSGLAYYVSPGHVLERIVEFSDGVAAGPSRDWLDLPPDGLRVDEESLFVAEDYGSAVFEDRTFTGIAYAFTADGRCYSETEFLGGHETETSLREWYETGEPKALIGGGEATSWLPNGRLRAKGVGVDVLLSLNTRDDGRLSSLVLYDRRLLDLETLRSLTPTDDFMMVGAAIDTEVLRALHNRTPIGTIRKLRLAETGVDRNAVEVLASFENLNELWLDRNPGLGLEDAREIELRRPGCAVHIELPAKGD